MASQLPDLRPRHQSADGSRKPAIRIRVTSRVFPHDFFDSTHLRIAPRKVRPDPDLVPQDSGTPHFASGFAFSFYKEQQPSSKPRSKVEPNARKSKDSKHNKAVVNIDGQMWSRPRARQEPLAELRVENTFKSFVMDKIRQKRVQ